MAIIKSTRPVVIAVALLVLTLMLTTSGLSRAAEAADHVAAAARANDAARVQELLASGADPNFPEPDGSTALLWAVYHAEPELALSLLAAGADPDAANQLGLTPLLQASRNGAADLVRALLAAGAGLQSSGHSNSEPALLAAARAGSAETVQLLLAAGADPDAVEGLDLQTALMWAAVAGQLDTARVLLEAGADPNRQARVNTLTVRKNADFPSGGFAALHWATRNGDEAMIDLLLQHGANLNLRNGDGATPMMLAIVNDRFDLAARLLTLGADADDGSLYYATEMRDGTTDWRARDGTVYRADHPNTLTALDLTRLLLEAGADPNRPFIGQMHNASMCCDTKANATPFYRASVAADVAGMQLMLAHGADPDWRPTKEVKAEDSEEMRSEPDKSALMAAITGGKGVGVAGGPNDLRYGPPPFREPANREPIDAVEILLAAGADVNARTPNGETALHLAAKALHPGIVRALVAAGAALDAQDKDGLTPQQAVAKMEAPKPVPGFHFTPPLAQPQEMAALLQELSGRVLASSTGQVP
jgi:ankyrin repeat protein